MLRFKIQEIIMKPKIRIGMVGGGRDAFIGNVHRMAIRMDDRAELVCGAFSSTKQKSLESGEDLLIDRSVVVTSSIPKRFAPLVVMFFTILT